MQELNKKWNKKDTVKKVTIIAGIFFVFLMAFFSAFGINRSSAQTSTLVQVAGCAVCGTITYGSHVTTGNLLVFAFNQVAGTTCDSSGVLTDSLGNSFFKLYGIGNPGYSNDVVCVYYVTSAFSGADTITMQATENTAIAFELNGFTINASQDTGGGASHSGSQSAQTWDYHAVSSLSMGVLTVELESAPTENSSGYFLGHLTATSGFTVEAQENASLGHGNNISPPNGNGLNPASLVAYAYGVGGANQNFPVSYVQPNTATASLFDVVGFSLVGLYPFNPFSTFTSSYSYTVTYSVCPSGNVSGTCTQTSGTTVIHYDNTSTTVITSGCDSDPTCATYSNSTTVVVTYTASSVILTTSTLTKTVTNTAINAPTGFQLQFWLVPLIFLMGPAFGFMGAYGAAVQERGGSVNGNNAVLLFLLGLNIGAIGGIILKVMPFPVLVVTMIPLVLLLYSMR